MSSSIPSGFIDLATFDELEKYLYGGSSAVTYFIRATKKSTWFTQVPTSLIPVGRQNFGEIWSAKVSRSGDYLLSTWLEVNIPAIIFKSTSTSTGLRWTPNLMHNLIEYLCVEFNDLIAYEINSYFLDFWTAFTTPAGKQKGYNTMIGNISSLTNPVAPGGTLPAILLCLPLPLCFTRDSGVSLPTAALPYNTITIKFKFRDWTELLIVDNINLPAGTNPSRPAVLTDIQGGAPKLGKVIPWANYALVSNDERKRMGCASRDILIEQIQTVPSQPWIPSTSYDMAITDIRFSHCIKVLFFGILNITTSSHKSNYTNLAPLPSQVLTIPTIDDSNGVDPLSNASLYYENTKRLDEMSSLYYSTVQPYYQPNATIPEQKGFHMYSYSLDFMSIDAKGSTNYGKLTNVSINMKASQVTIDSYDGNLAFPSVVYPPTWVGKNWWPQKYSTVILGVSNNIVRVSGGSLGFPIL